MLPIAVFAHDSKLEETNRHEVEFPFLKILQFEFYKVQLKKLPWRQSLASNNPVAVVLLSKEVQRVMKLTTSWHLKGWQQGRQEGRQEILLRQLRKRLGIISSEVEGKINKSFLLLADYVF